MIRALPVWVVVLSVACQAEEVDTDPVTPLAFEHPWRIDRFDSNGTALEFGLRSTPVSETLEVDVRTQPGITYSFQVCPHVSEDCEVLWQPDRNSVLFVDWTPEIESEVVVRYRDLLVYEPIQ